MLLYLISNISLFLLPVKVSQSEEENKTALFFFFFFFFSLERESRGRVVVRVLAYKGARKSEDTNWKFISNLFSEN